MICASGEVNEASLTLPGSANPGKKTIEKWELALDMVQSIKFIRYTHN